MFLEKLEIFGFKSFSEKLEVRFSQGITGVIGPNGCGKTNISDALRWVLGEQNMRHLRGDVAEDVIFGGTDRRKPLGMAEATLTISNTRNLLPTEFSQVQIGRRIYRSGESQYLFNKNSVRLKDIRNLFFDTGMGANAYSVIERHMVDAILAEGSVQRRSLFEEAAGITKYKTRKRESMNKLEATETDLIRVNDLVVEIEKELRSLKYQAGKARRWQRMHEEIREMDLRLAAHAQGERVARVAQLEETLAGARTSVEGEVAGLASAEAGLEAARLCLLEGEKALATAQADLNALTAGMAELRSRISVGEERARGLLAQLEQGEADQARLAAQIRQLESERDRLRAEEAELQAGLAQRQSQLEGEEKTLREAENALSAKRAGLNAQRQLSLDLMQDEIQRRAELEQLKAYLGRCQERLAKLAEEGQELQARRRGIDARCESGREALVEQQAALERIKQEQASREARVVELTGQTEALLHEEREARDRAATLASRLKTLEELKANFEGFEAGVRALFQERAGAGARGVVADLMDVPREWVDALEVFLGPVLQAVVVERDEAAYEARGFLMERERGRVNFLTLERVGRHAPVPLPQDIAGQPGVVGYAPGIVRVKEGLSSLADLLLGHVVLVEDAGTARRLSERHAGQPWGFLTRQGEFWGPHRLQLGSGAGGTQILHREQEIRDLLANGEIASAELRRIVEARGSVEADLTRCREELKELRLRHAAAEESLHEAERRLNGALTERRVAEGEAETRAAEHAQLVRERDALVENIRSGEDTFAGKSRQAEEARRGASELEEELAGLEARREACQKTTSEVRVEWARVHTRCGELAARRSEVEHLLETTRQALSARSEEAAARMGERGSLLTELEALSARSVTDAGQLSRRQEDVRQLEEAHLHARSDAGNADAAVRELRKTSDAGREQIHRMELELLDTRSALEQDLTRIKVEYELEDLEVLTRQPPPLDGETPERLAGLKARIRGLGPVNPLAMEEYLKHKERFDFLTTQRDDLVQARTQLLEVIEKINTSARELFGTTFQAVREKFKEVFATVFEGGECDLVVEGDDPLEAQIEIMARPKGKRLQTISLLSTGERSLTAISLLFGLYLVKPSPFCILDEVDAPLDDANIDRFTSLLRHFSRHTQFVVITHNKKTMEICDALYGVTMQEPGSSKIVSVKLEREGEEVGHGNGAGARNGGNGNGNGNGDGEGDGDARGEAADPAEPALT